MSRVGIGIAGCGYWGPNLVRNFAGLRDAEVVALCDVIMARAEETQLLAPGASTTTDYNQLLGNERVEAVVVTTPAQSHYELARRALESGRHVLVEKPMAMASQDADELVRLADERSLVLMAGHTFLYSPPVRKIKELLAGGAIGPVLAVDSNRVNLGIFRGDVDVLWDLGPHDVSIITHLLSRLPETVAAGGASYMREGVCDTGYFDFRFPGGQMAHVFLSWLSPVKLRRMTIVGQKGMILYDDTEEMEKVKVYQGDSRYPTPEELQHSSDELYRLGDIHIPSLPRLEPLRAQCEDFLYCIRAGEAPVSSGIVGAQVIRVLEGAHRSMEQDGRQVSLEWAGV